MHFHHAWGFALSIQSVLEHTTALEQHSTAQLSTAQHSTAQHSTAQHSTAQHSTAQHSTVQRSRRAAGQKEGSWPQFQLQVMSLKAPTAHQAIDDVDQAYGCCGLLHPKAAQHQMLTAPPAELSMLWEVTQHHTLTKTLLACGAAGTLSALVGRS